MATPVRRGRSRPRPESHEAQYDARVAELARPVVSSRPRTLVVELDPPELIATLVAPTGAVIGAPVRTALADGTEPVAVIDAVWRLAEELGEFDRLAFAYPGAVTGGVTQYTPGLGEVWDGFGLAGELARQSLRPARVVDDCELVAHAAIAGRGVELVLTLGARFGSALFVDGAPVPGFVLGRHRFRKKQSYADYVAGDAFARVGRKKWNARVRKVVAEVLAVWNPRQLYLGGRDARLIYGELPANVEVLGPPSLAAAIWLWG